MIAQERDSISKALLLAREEFELADDELVVMLADMSCEFGADMALAYHGDEDRLAEDVRDARQQARIPVLVNVMPPQAWHAFFTDYAPLANQMMEQGRPPNTVALAVVGAEGVVVAFAERTLRVLSPFGLH
jgi:hypothetical protein